MPDLLGSGCAISCEAVRDVRYRLTSMTDSRVRSVSQGCERGLASVDEADLECQSRRIAGPANEFGGVSSGAF